jgi:hypothetical protein
MNRKLADDFWDYISIAVPYNFEPAAREAAHRQGLMVTEYIRRALLLRLEADGIRLADFEDARA